MSLSNDILFLRPIGKCWEADVLFTGGGIASGVGENQLEAMEAVRDNIDTIIQELSVKRTLLENLIERTASLSPRTPP